MQVPSLLNYQSLDTAFPKDSIFYFNKSCCCAGAAVKRPPHIDIVVLYLLILVFFDCRIQNIFESRVVLNPGLDDVRNIASYIISHLQAKCRFQSLDFVFPKDPLFKFN